MGARGGASEITTSGEELKWGRVPCCEERSCIERASPGEGVDTGTAPGRGASLGEGNRATT
jgi:hypothetical protein